LLQAKRDQAEAAVLYNYSTMSTNPSTSLTDSFSVFNNPIYGITTQDTEALLPQVAAYSGNMSSVPFGSNLSQLYDPLDYVRLTLTINTGSGSSLPGLWLFLLVILAALGLIIASTSISMHVSQYRARRDLRRRIAAGEIDLESLGIKRLTVPKEMIDTMPIRIYGSSSITYSAPAIARQNEKPHRASIRRSSADGDSRLSVSSNLPTSENAQKTGSTDDTPSTTGEIVSQTPPPPPAGFEQSSSCAICLDDYVVNTTPVRQLPCNHLFHPHCIDPYLSTRSSLCPLCKRSVLPKGFIPPSLQLTNATVARERRIRLMRERISRRQTSSPDPEQLAGGVEMVNIGGGISGDNHMNAPTQEEEDEELRQRGWGRRVMETIFPRFTRPTGGSVRNPRRRSQYGSN
jgi:Ring finger domain